MSYRLVVPAAPRRRRPAFTLVELLVVIGIIALLMGILLPALSKAKEQGNQIKCLSNIRQLGMAFVMYANANKGNVPYCSWNDGTQLFKEDWLWWQAIRADRIDESSVQPYLGFKESSLEMLRCPTDQLEVGRKPNSAVCGPYKFSYVMNWYIASGATNAYTPQAAYPAENITIAKKLTQIRATSDKVLLYEEDESTIDDGQAVVWHPGSGPNLLAIRHDTPRKKEPDSLNSATYLPNPNGRGNVTFADGHAEYVSRSFVHTKSATVPNSI